MKLQSCVHDTDRTSISSNMRMIGLNFQWNLPHWSSIKKMSEVEQELDNSCREMFKHFEAERLFRDSPMQRRTCDVTSDSHWPRGIGARLWRSRLRVRVLVVPDTYMYPMYVHRAYDTRVPSGFPGYIWLDTKIVKIYVSAESVNTFKNKWKAEGELAGFYRAVSR